MNWIACDFLVIVCGLFSHGRHVSFKIPPKVVISRHNVDLGVVEFGAHNKRVIIVSNPLGADILEAESRGFGPFSYKVVRHDENYIEIEVSGDPSLLDGFLELELPVYTDRGEIILNVTAGSRKKVRALPIALNLDEDCRDAGFVATYDKSLLIRDVWVESADGAVFLESLDRTVLGVVRGVVRLVGGGPGVVPVGMELKKCRVIFDFENGEREALLVGYRVPVGGGAQSGLPNVQK